MSSQLNQNLLSRDLDHIIGQRSTLITGVLPSKIEGVEFTATLTNLNEGRSVELSGIYEEADTEICINANNYTNLPSVGSILKDTQNRQYKVLSISNDFDENPIEKTFSCVSRHLNQ